MHGFHDGAFAYSNLTSSEKIIVFSFWLSAVHCTKSNVWLKLLVANCCLARDENVIPQFGGQLDVFSSSTNFVPLFAAVKNSSA